MTFGVLGLQVSSEMAAYAQGARSLVRYLRDRVAHACIACAAGFQMVRQMAADAHDGDRVTVADACIACAAGVRIISPNHTANGG